MKTFTISCLILSIVATLHAQQAAPQPSRPPLPSGPLLKRAPDYSTWTVTFQGHPIEEKEPVKPTPTGDGKSKEKEPVTMLSSVVKTGTTFLEQNVEANGRRHQVWHVSGMRVVAGSPTPMICPDYGGGDIVSIDFASSDFAGFDWLSPNTYSGIIKYEGSDCIVFTGSISPLSVSDQRNERAFIQGMKALGQPVAGALRVPAIAYIHLATRLPVFAQFGQEKRIYQYGAPPQTPLALPPELANSLKAYEQQMARLSAPASRPY